MQNKNKLISIILNCYNGEKYLEEALSSIISQTYKNWELIFWDNKSTDKSRQIFNSFKSKKFRYFKSKKHVSLYKAKNFAIKKVENTIELNSSNICKIILESKTFIKPKIIKSIFFFEKEIINFISFFISMNCNNYQFAKH